MKETFSYMLFGLTALLVISSLSSQETQQDKELHFLSQPDNEVVIDETVEIIEIEEKEVTHHHHHHHYSEEEIVHIDYHDYDFYVFVVQWSNTFCHTHHDPESCFGKLNSLERNDILTIHGLWPSMKAGYKPFHCHTGPDIHVEHSHEEPYSTMEQVWPSFSSDEDYHFWDHEYNKHGYCYVKRTEKAGYLPFFEKGLSLYYENSLDNLIKQAFNIKPGDEISMTYDAMMDAFSEVTGGTYFEMQCSHHDGKQLLSEIRFYFDMDFSKMYDFKYHTHCDMDQDVTILYQENAGNLS